ncbi:GNAT family N-acetyltransferase [Sphingomonas rubra]|uniref:Putative acetyltransferase n=1 Tax=Sphingomonas rubra TaxID=634430 RepID=A0A1I5T9U1_9SPHN|nr:GNAT family N-acetyltransferase [Sphingomonas rubra]SFP79601.1 putative acetyltransferase [Sphingomonas rubra]
MVDIRQDDPRSPHVAALLAAHLAEQRGAVPEGFSFALGADALAAADVTFFTAWIDGTLAGFGALRQLDARHGEVKSMRSAMPGHGIGAALLGRIVAEARARGYDRLSLETGVTASYRPAVALYERAGFVDAEPFADYEASPHNRFMTLAL